MNDLKNVIVAGLLKALKPWLKDVTALMIDKVVADVVAKTSSKIDDILYAAVKEQLKAGLNDAIDKLEIK